VGKNRALIKRIAFAATLLVPSGGLAQPSAVLRKSAEIEPRGPRENINLIGSGKFFSQDGAAIHRINDRLFVGAATDNDGAFPNVRKDWLATLQTSWGAPVGYTAFSMLNVLTNSDPGTGNGILGGAQTLHLQPSGSAVGVQGHAIANQPSSAAKAFALYGEAHRVVAGAGDAYGLEVDVIAHVASVAPTPNRQGNAIGIQVASGGGYAGFRQQETSAGIQFANNGSRFKTAINVMRGSVVGTNPAIELPTGNGLSFTDETGHVGATISANFTKASRSNLNFSDAGIQVTGAPIILPSFTVANLPICNAALRGGMAYVDDAAEPTYNGALKGGGSIAVPVFCNGSSWTSH
jgi:hypothetical protein